MDQPEAELIGGRDAGPPTFSGMEKRLRVHLPGLGVMNDEPALHPLVLRGQPDIDPERDEPNQFLLFLTHGPRHIHHVDDHGVRFRLDRRPPRAVAFVLFHRPDSRVLHIVTPGHDLPSQGLAKGALEVAQRLGPGLCDPDVLVLLGGHVLFAPGFDIGKGQFLRHDFREFLEAHLNLENVLSRLRARLARAPGVRVYGDWVSGVSFTLADTLAGPAETKARDLQLRQGNGDQVFPPLADEFALGEVLANPRANGAADNFLESCLIAVYSFRHVHGIDPCLTPCSPSGHRGQRWRRRNSAHPSRKHHSTRSC